MANLSRAREDSESVSNICKHIFQMNTRDPGGYSKAGKTPLPELYARAIHNPILRRFPSELKQNKKEKN